MPVRQIAAEMYPDAPLFAVILFAALSVAVLGRYIIRAWYREKRRHLRALMEMPEEGSEEEDKKEERER